MRILLFYFSIYVMDHFQFSNFKHISSNKNIKALYHMKDLYLLIEF
jgi:hypothetical protein